MNNNFTELYNAVTGLTSSVQRLQATYRWNVFDTKAGTSYGYFLGNDGNMFGGVSPFAWGNNGIASNMSTDKEILRTLFVNKGYAKKNAMVYASHYSVQSDSNYGRVVVVLFRIKNTTGSVINWTPYFYYSVGNYGYASVALNGNNSWSSSSPGMTTGNITLSLPAGMTSTVIFVSNSIPATTVNNVVHRSIQLGFYNNSLELPAGLEYVDDLDIAN